MRKKSFKNIKELRKNKLNEEEITEKIVGIKIKNLERNRPKKSKEEKLGKNEEKIFFY